MSAHHLSLAEMKAKLERNGFLVIPKERVLKLQYQSAFADYYRACLSNWKEVRESAELVMGRWIGEKIVADRACEMTESEIKDAGGGMSTLVRMEARVIVPKEFPQPRARYRRLPI